MSLADGDPRPGEWKCCYHLSVDEHGICRDCGKRARIFLEEKPVNGDITFAIEEFETACDTAITAIGEDAAYKILMQRRERFNLILKLAPKDKNSWEQVRGVSDPERQARLDATARDARQHMEEEQDKREDEHVAMIKAMNKAGL